MGERKRISIAAGYKSYWSSLRQVLRYQIKLVSIFFLVEPRSAPCQWCTASGYFLTIMMFTSLCDTRWLFTWIMQWLVSVFLMCCVSLVLLSTQRTRVVRLGLNRTVTQNHIRSSSTLSSIRMSQSWAFYCNLVKTYLVIIFWTR